MSAQSVLIEDFSTGVPPTGWENKRSVFADARPGFSCGPDGAVDDGTGAKFNAAVGEASWLVSPDIGATGATSVSCWCRTGVEFTGEVLGFLVEASADGETFAEIGRIDAAGETYAKAGPFELPTGTRFVKFSHVKLEGWAVWIGAIVFE